MKKAIILSLALLCIVSLYSEAQQIGDDAEKVKSLVQMAVQEYYNAQGYHQVKEDYKVLMDNGSIAEIVLQKENVPDANLQRAISFRIRYIISRGKLSRILQEYFDVSVSELRNAFKANYRGNVIYEYYFNSDLTAYSKIYLSSNRLAAVETKETDLNDFPASLRELIKKDRLAIEKDKKEKNTVEQELGTANMGTFRTNAEFKGGSVARSQYFKDNFQYPDTAVKNHIEGSVTVDFVIDTDGSVINIEIPTGYNLGYGLPEEAERLVSNMPKWKPATIDSKPIQSNQQTTILFSLKNWLKKDARWFTGTKRFCDGLGEWYYKVTINGNGITLLQYADRKNKLHKDKINPVETIQGIIEANKIITKDAPEYKTNRFKFENGVLYEVNNEGDYNSYQECQN